jgi:biotin carboxylase
MTRILILGASTLQIPAIKSAKALGFIVGVVDYNPKAPGIEFADVYFNFSTNDTDRIIKAAKEFRADGIMTMATDMPMQSVAKACEELHLPGISLETAIIATDKYRMMEVFKEHSVPHPWFYKVNTLHELMVIKKELAYPCVIKPTDNSGSRGVILVRSETELSNAYGYSTKESRSGSVIIQEYMVGKEVSVEVMVKNNEPHIVAITDKITTGEPFFVEMAHSQPSQQNEKQIAEVAKKAVYAVGISRGPAHVEIMVTPEGPKLIELGARLGGDFITSHLVPLSTGVDIVKATILDSCGMVFNIESTISKTSMIKYLTTDFGVIEHIRGIEEAKQVLGVVDVKLFKGIGDSIGDIHSSNDRVGCVIVQEDDSTLAEDACNKVLNCIKICTSRYK